MATRRTKKQIEALDERIRPLYVAGSGCRVIAEALGEHPAMIYKRVRAMGLNRTREEAEQIQVKTAEGIPFQTQPVPTTLSAAALGVAIRWFLERGHIPSIPVEPTRYDLIVESKTGLQRVQVKTTAMRDRKGTGPWVVYTSRSAYDRNLPIRSDGKRSRVAYTEEEVDFFFVVTEAGDKYLIPRASTGDALSVSLDTKYAAFKVE